MDTVVKFNFNGGNWSCVLHENAFFSRYFENNIVFGHFSHVSGFFYINHVSYIIWDRCKFYFRWGPWTLILL